MGDIGWILIGIACLLLVFILVLVIRALTFNPKKVIQEEREDISFDGDRTVECLGELVKCKTVSYRDHSLEDDAEFEKLINKLPSLYPNVHKVCSFQRFEDRGILFHWKGKEEGEPAVLMAHYDVVPVDEKNWDNPPFDALIIDDVMWGRGTLDTKVTFNGILSAAETLIKDGFTPKHDMYFAFSGGEEINGDGALNIVKYFKEKGITPSFVLDEGGAVVENVFPGVKSQCGLIGIAEKGQINAKFTIQSNGGHASSPPPHTPIGLLSKACLDLENHPLKKHYTKPVLDMFDTLGRHSSFVYKLIFGNLWLFSGLLDSICKKSGGELNALVRTTIAFTQMTGSAAPNVLPSEATMVANLRLNPEDSVEKTLNELKRKINNDKIEISTINSFEPSPISRTDCEGWKIISNAVSSTWEGCLVSPYLMVQCSDSRHYALISDKVYRFSAMHLSAEERKMIHGNNERIPLDTIKKAVEFFIRVEKKC